MAQEGGYEEHELVRLGGLWMQTSKDGKTRYWQGRLGGARMVIFKNRNKKGEKDPEFILYVQNSPKQDRQAQEQRPDDDDVPF